MGVEESCVHARACANSAPQSDSLIDANCHTQRTLARLEPRVHIHETVHRAAALGPVTSLLVPYERLGYG